MFVGRSDELKINLLNIPRGYTCEKALISLYGPDKSLSNAEYFDHYVTLKDILPTRR